MNTGSAHVLEDGYDIWTVQQLPGHKDAITTMARTRVLNRGCRGVRGRLDSLLKAASRESGGIIRTSRSA